MRLTGADLEKILGILERIDQGKVDPQVPDRIGRFLRQYKNGRRQLDDVLAHNACARRDDATISGEKIGPIELHPLAELRIRAYGFPKGDLGETLAVSEELGALVNLALWLKGPLANAAYNVLREKQGLRLSGDYRWTPPTRVTSGEASSLCASRVVRWDTARCLKAVADDLLRPAHALEYVVDYHHGLPGLKFFRSICARRNGSQWDALPAFAAPRRLEVEATLPAAATRVRDASLASLLVYSEPWSRSWTIVDAIPIAADEVLAHIVAWADFRGELEGSALEAGVVRDIIETCGTWGVEPCESFQPDLPRVLLPLARQIVRSLRGYP